MKKTKLTRSLLAACSIVALSAVMYGCIHGGDDDPAPTTMMVDPPQPPEPPAPDPEPEQPAPAPAPDERIAALQEEINALRAELGLDPIDIDDLTDNVAELMQQVSDLQDEIDMRDMAAEEAARAAAAAEAEALFAGIEGDRGGDGADLVVTVSAMTVTDEHDGSAAIAQATDGTTFLTTLPADTVTVDSVTATDAMEPMLAGEWKGTQLTGANTDGTVSSTVVVYTDIDAPMQVAFGSVYTLDTEGHLTGASGDPAEEWLQHADNRSKIVAADFMHTGRMVHDPDPASATDVVMIRGSFNGASGEYRCLAADATSCVSHDDGDGAVRLEGTWLFDPDVGAMATQLDDTYLFFGWWLHKDSEGPEVDAFHGVTGTGLTAITEADFTALGGTATYSGGAAGKYAIDPVSPGTDAHGGHWTADASLTADFGNETDNGTISGMIDNFMAGDEEMDWSVALGATVMAATGAFNTGTDATATTGSNAVVWTIATEAAPSAGAWSGNLYNQGDDNIPTAATGEFSATYNEDGHEIGHMIGAFGAHLDE